MLQQELLPAENPFQQLMFECWKRSPLEITGMVASFLSFSDLIPDLINLKKKDNKGNKERTRLGRLLFGHGFDLESVAIGTEDNYATLFNMLRYYVDSPLCSNRHHQGPLQGACEAILKFKKEFELTELKEFSTNFAKFCCMLKRGNLSYLIRKGSQEVSILKQSFLKLSGSRDTSRYGLWKKNEQKELPASMWEKKFSPLKMVKHWNRSDLSGQLLEYRSDLFERPLEDRKSLHDKGIETIFMKKNRIDFVLELLSRIEAPLQINGTLWQLLRTYIQYDRKYLEGEGSKVIRVDSNNGTLWYEDEKERDKADIVLIGLLHQSGYIEHLERNVLPLIIQDLDLYQRAIEAHGYDNLNRNFLYDYQKNLRTAEREELVLNNGPYDIDELIKYLRNSFDTITSLSAPS